MCLKLLKSAPELRFKAVCFMIHIGECYEIVKKESCYDCKKSKKIVDRYKAGEIELQPFFMLFMVSTENVTLGPSDLK